jgi:hypothetical protein
MLILLVSEQNVCKSYIMGNNCKGSNRVLRGGSWNNTPQNSRVANRNNNTPDNRNNNIGFRVVSSQLKRSINRSEQNATQTDVKPVKPVIFPVPKRAKSE